MGDGGWGMGDGGHTGVKLCGSLVGLVKGDEGWRGLAGG